MLINFTTFVAGVIEEPPITRVELSNFILALGDSRFIVTDLLAFSLLALIPY